MRAADALVVDGQKPVLNHLEISFLQASANLVWERWWEVPPLVLGVWAVRRIRSRTSSL